MYDYSIIQYVASIAYNILYDYYSIICYMYASTILVWYYVLCFATVCPLSGVRQTPNTTNDNDNYTYD